MMMGIEASVLQSGGGVAAEVQAQNTTQKEAPRMSNTLVFLPLMEDALSVAGGFVLSMAMGCLFFSIRVVRSLDGHSIQDTNYLELLSTKKGLRGLVTGVQTIKLFQFPCLQYCIHRFQRGIDG
ncbi:uncharacterized protein [Triticum aestivum]|uniref:uncharacterized protein isoform X2 n=1 Tax=Triticum aestivum TaxID=4565 RepID=UPI001D01F9DE|nr:uncharacterized protein LOC123164871 isoform X2 [Triticum aestivum]